MGGTGKTSREQDSLHMFRSSLANMDADEVAIFIRSSLTGTSTSTPTVVARAAGDVVPKIAIATATANSKKLDAPIMPEGAAML